MTDMIWEVPPPAPTRGRKGVDIGAFVDGLLAHPGETARFPRPLSSLSTSMRNETRIQWETRRRPDGKYDIWGTFPGDTLSIQEG